ncbi:MAG: sigma-70 family RNA polymerase sigma factor [Armatimonadetes bacterium]|nr:sigma-70 family RNA polymerase sigma factor [Armatimonadota bacterium]
MPQTPTTQDTEASLLQQYDALAHRIARNYHAKIGAHYELDELVQQARLGILTAIRTYDASRGAKFITHAYNSARFAVSRYTRKYPGCLTARKKPDGTPMVVQLHPSIAVQDVDYGAVERSVEIERLLECLEEDEKEVCIKMHYEGRSARETALEMPGMTPYKVLLLNRSALEKLRSFAAENGIEV